MEVELSGLLGVSRTPLREALKLLAAEGLVELRLNRSAVVAPVRCEEIAELFEAVSGIERIAAELAAVRMTARDLQRLRDLHERMERFHEAGELRDYFDLNQQIHELHRRLRREQRAEIDPRHAHGPRRARTISGSLIPASMGRVGSGAC